MDIQALKLELVKLVVNIDNPKLIDQMIKLLKADQEDFWLGLSEKEKEEIQTGIRQLDSGHRTSLEDFLKKVS